ncbi:DUF262 domain-containing protein [Paeniglutamicibacter sulfureus]|uniref:DUF262 domain-containing protein n=1 Tax=Paeniglutamicibacter sulfureus TaxID=43666 RepID=A0ABU2BHN7_9MICC|nr:DUF262 domain-containing protein [Paeniglutamicibacter sulfureus]MDR7357253.1 hypothetical protein [Paeniglutamicibacter sulfureus]
MSQTTALNGAFEGRVVGSISGDFVVPGYQRGYRWGRPEVQRLLEDIQESEGATYYLQPIVVKRLDENRWELVDGQQRLTTLFLILQFIKQTALPSAEVPYTLEYDTRPQSAEFLRAPSAEGSANNIDFFHIFQAWNCIEEWFEGQGIGKTLAAINLYKALSERVKVIWYEAPDYVSSTALFTRLNVGKIPLTDAELVKALVLSRSQNLVAQTDRAQSMAAEWDVIERDLRTPELWAFLTGSPRPEATHISLLLDTLAGGPSGRERPPFHTFETLREQIMDNADEFWNKVVNLHSLVLGWFEDRNLFHKIGYLVATNSRFEDILDLAQGSKKSEFDTKLNVKIQDGLSLSEENLRELSYESSYGRQRISAALLLMNVETIRKQTNSTERYSFRAHATGQWSLEHIHAQNAEELRTGQQWLEWLRLHRDALSSLPNIQEAERVSLEARIDEALPDLNESKFRELELELSPYFVPDEDGTAESNVHTITNLALLDSRDNSALSNSWFEVKRLEVLKRDREGSYIPVCTRNVFLKYYTGERAQQVHYWSMQDRESYLTAIEREIGPYLLGDSAGGVSSRKSSQ